MNRGTLMVLKRLMVTTLGALGLGALLATGAAFAQAQIPAPDDLAPPGAPPADTMGCAVVPNAVIAPGLSSSDVTDVTVCADANLSQDAMLTPIVTEARAADAAVVVMQSAVDVAQTAVDNLDSSSTPTQIALAENALAAAKVRLTAAQNARTSLGESSQLAKAALDELEAIRSINAAGAIVTSATAAATQTENDLNALQFDADGNNVASGGTTLTALQTAYDSAVSSFTGATTDADRASAAQALIDAKHDLDAAMRDGTYLLFKATLDAQEQAQMTAEANLTAAQKDKTDAAANINSGLVGMPAPDASSDDVTARIARIVGQFQEDLADARMARTDAMAADTAAGVAETSAQTEHTNSQTRLANARAAYAEAAKAIAADGTRPTDADELEALVAAEVEYADAFFAEADAKMALDNAKKAATATANALEAANMAVAAAQDKVNNPAAHAYIFDADNPAGALTDALLSGDDTGGALITAIDETYDETQENSGRIDEIYKATDVTDADGNTTTMKSGLLADLEEKVGTLAGTNGSAGQVSKLKEDLDALTEGADTPDDPTDDGAVTRNTNDIAALTAGADTPNDPTDDGAVTRNTNEIGQIDVTVTTNEEHIAALAAMDDPDTLDVNEDGRVTVNERHIDDLQVGLFGETRMQDGGSPCEAGGGALNIANCAQERIDDLTAGADTPDPADDGAITANTVGVAANGQSISGLTAGADTADTSDDGVITANTVRSSNNATDIDTLQDEVGLDVNGDGTVMLPDGTMGSRIDDNAAKLALKAQYIANLGAEVGIDAATGDGTVKLADGTMGSRIDQNAEDIATETTNREMEDDRLAGEGHTVETIKGNADDIATETTNREMEDDRLAGAGHTVETIKGNADDIAQEITDRMTADTNLGVRIDQEVVDLVVADTALGVRIDGEEMARMTADGMLGERIDDEATARMTADGMLGGRIDSNAGAIAANMNSIGSNASAISDNRNMIGELSDDLDVVRAGVAASMALAGMPAINGRGIAIGVGSFDGESAFAVGFQIQGEQTSFKVGVTSASGATGASAGVGFNF